MIAWPLISRARHETALERIAELTEELRSVRACIERMTDNALFGAGMQPIFDPAASRFQVRSVEDQRADNAQSPRPLTAAEWRRRAELLDLETAERDRKGRLAEDLRRLAAERRTPPAPPVTAAIALLLTFVCGPAARFAKAQSQSPQTNSPYAAGAAVASSFDGWSTSGTAIGQSGQDGSITITAAGRVVAGGVVVYPFFVGNLITIDAGAQQENVTILSSNCSGTGEEDCNIVAFFTLPHNGNLPVSSATFGLREAIQAMKGGGGQVLITPAWGGATSMITSAPGAANVSIVDSRFGNETWYGWDGTAYVVSLALNSPPPGISSLNLHSLIASSPAITPTTVEYTTYADQFATAGIGTSVNPWTGWAAAVTASPAGSAVQFPCGYYSTSATLTITPSAAVYLGSNGSGCTTLVFTGITGPGFIFNGLQLGGTSNLAFSCPDLTTATACVQVTGNPGLTAGNRFHGLTILGPPTPVPGSLGIEFAAPVAGNYFNVLDAGWYINNFGWGIKIDPENNAEQIGYGTCSGNFEGCVWTQANEGPIAFFANSTPGQTGVSLSGCSEVSTTVTCALTGGALTAALGDVVTVAGTTVAAYNGQQDLTAACSACTSIQFAAAASSGSSTGGSVTLYSIGARISNSGVNNADTNQVSIQAEPGNNSRPYVIEAATGGGTVDKNYIVSTENTTNSGIDNGANDTIAVSANGTFFGGPVGIPGSGSGNYTTLTSLCATASCNATFQNSSGTVAWTSQLGNCNGGSNCVMTNPSTPQLIQPSANVVPLTIEGFNGGTSDLFDVELPSAAKVFSVDSSGSTNVPNNLNVSGAVISNGAAAGFLRLYESPSNGINYVGFQAPVSLSASTSWTPPIADGASDQSFCTNGAAVLFFCGYHGHVTVASGTNPTASLPFPAAFASAPDCTATPQSDVGSGNRWAVTSNTSGATVAVFGTLGGSVVFNVNCGGH